MVKAGANVLVAGNAIFAGNDPKTYKKRIAAIRTAATTVSRSTMLTEPRMTFVVADLDRMERRAGRRIRGAQSL